MERLRLAASAASKQQRLERAQLVRTIQQLQKQLDVAQTTAAMATARDVRPGSHYRQEIASLNKALVDKDDIIQQQDSAIERMMMYYSNTNNTSSTTTASSSTSSTSSSSSPRLPSPTSPDGSQNTSVCSSLLMDEDDTSASSSSSVAAGTAAPHRHQQQRSSQDAVMIATLQNEIKQLKAQIVANENNNKKTQSTLHDNEDEGIISSNCNNNNNNNNDVQEDLRKRLAMTSRLLHESRRQAETSQKEVRLLDEQLLVLKEEISVLKDQQQQQQQQQGGGEKRRNNKWMPMYKHKRNGGGSGEEDEYAKTSSSSSSPSSPSRSVGGEKSRLVVELETELVNVKKSLIVSEGEIKRLQNALWVSKIQHENKIDLADEVENVKSNSELVQTKLVEAQNVIERQQVDLQERNDTIVRLNEQLQRYELVSKNSSDSSNDDRLSHCRNDSFESEWKKLDDLQARLDAKEQEHEDAVKQSKALMDQLQSKSDELIALKQESLSKGNQVIQLKEQVETFADKLETGQKEILDLKQTISKLESKSIQSSKDVGKFKQSVTLLEAAKRQSDLEHENCAKELETARGRIAELETLIESKRFSAVDDSDLKRSEGVERDDGGDSESDITAQENRDELLNEKRSLLEKVEALTTEIAELKKRNESETDETSVAKLLEEARIEHARSLASISMNSQVTIDTLRKDLASAREKCAADVAKLTASLSSARTENERLMKMLDATKLKDQQIYALEQTLYAQESTVDSLKSELSQLQSNYSKAIIDRKKDMEEMQSEFVEQVALVKTKDRELESLSMELEGTKAQHEEVVQGLLNKIKNMETESPLTRTMRELQHANMVVDVKERLESLKVMNIELKEENLKLTSRLERAAIKVKTIEAEKAMAEEAEKECHELRQRVKAMESLLEQQFDCINTMKGKTIGKSTLSITKGDQPSEKKGGFIGKLSRNSTAGKADDIPSILVIDSSIPPIDEEL